jgi:hypothetical protein
MGNYEWLKEIKDETLSNPITHRPHTLELNGEDWTIATDGHLLVGVKAYDPALLNCDSHDLPKLRTAAGYARAMLSPCANGEIVSFAELRNWVGVDAVKACPFCRGSGHADDVRWNSGNEEFGPVSFWDEPDHALLYGFPLNRNLLKLPFFHLQSETVRVARLESLTHGSSNGCFPLQIEGENWRVVIMGVKDPGPNPPRFPSTEAEQWRKAASDSIEEAEASARLAV